MTTSPTPAELDLPFFINGTLEPEAARAVSANLDADPALAQEAQALTNLRTAMQAEDPLASPGEFGLARLMRDIKAEDAPQTAPAPRTTLWRAQGFALAAAIAGLAALLLPMLSQTPAPEPVFEQASGAVGGDLVVSFADSATAAQIADLLLDTGLVIVEGPSALGLYHLAVQDDLSPEAALTQLEQAPTIVTYVERAE